MELGQLYLVLSAAHTVVTRCRGRQTTLGPFRAWTGLTGGPIVTADISDVSPASRSISTPPGPGIGQWMIQFRFVHETLSLRISDAEKWLARLSLVRSLRVE